MNKKAFTLIELLVVVLIIGILAAIALPQYERAVEKTRYTQLIALARALANAEEVYYLANNEYTADFDKLDIDMPPHGDIESIADDGEHTGGRIRIPQKAIVDLYVTRVGAIKADGTGPRFFCYYKNITHSNAGRCFCYGYSEDTIGVCKSLGGQLDGEYDSEHLSSNFYYF